MTLFVWDDSFSVHISHFDRQHRHLVSLVNRLHDAMKAGSVKEVLEPILDDLVRYTQEHFSAEEGLMLIHHYPGYMEHKAEHDAFIAKVLDFQKEYQKGSLALTLEVMNFLLEWVKSHIKVVDQRYGPYLSEKGVL